jgi:cytochrome d ubiquinol oxidase subunit II
MPEPTLANVLAGVVVLALNAYVVLAGADFGGGVWDLLATGPRRQRQRELIAHAIGPVWEANHVWLILAVVLLFTCFPPVFARLAITLHVPLTLMLVGIVLRGSAFTFRSYGSESDVAERRWGRTFAIASLVTPILLGASVGAVAAGRVQGRADRGFVQGFIDPWLTPFALSIGLLALCLFAFLAAVYLTLETRDAALQEDFRRRALLSGFSLFPAALLTLLLAGEAPGMRAGLLFSARGLLIQLPTAIAAVTALLSLRQRHYRVARVAAIAQASCIVWGWAIAQYPMMLPTEMTIAGAAAPAITLELVAGALSLGALVLLPSLAYLFRVFKAAGH